MVGLGVGWFFLGYFLATFLLFGVFQKVLHPRFKQLPLCDGRSTVAGPPVAPRRHTLPVGTKLLRLQPKPLAPHTAPPSPNPPSPPPQHTHPLFSIEFNPGTASDSTLRRRVTFCTTVNKLLGCSQVRNPRLLVFFPIFQGQLCPSPSLQGAAVTTIH